MPRKNKAAQSLAKKRWAGTTQAERSAEMAEVAAARMTALTAEQRSEIARKAGRANAGKKRKPGAGRPKKQP